MVLIREDTGWQAQQLQANGSINLTVGSLTIQANGNLDYQLQNPKEKDINGSYLETIRVSDTAANLSIGDVNGIQFTVDDAYIVDGNLKNFKGSAKLDKFYDFRNVTLSIGSANGDPANTSMLTISGDYQYGDETWRGAATVYSTDGTLNLSKGIDISAYKPGSEDMTSLKLGYTAESSDDSDSVALGPLKGATVFLDQRIYDQNGQFQENSNLKPDDDEPKAISDAIGDFKLGNTVSLPMDSNKDNVIDYRDGLLVSLPDPAGLVTDSISGLKIDLPLVGIPGGGLNILTTLKYTALLRWQPGDTITTGPNSAEELSPELITELFATRLKNCPEAFLNDDYRPYSLLTSGSIDKQKEALQSLNFSYTYLSIVEAIKTVFETYKLVYGINEGYTDEEVGLLWERTTHLDPQGVDQASIVAYSALGLAILSRFGPSANGVNLSDAFGREALAEQFDPHKKEHIREILLEVLAQYPLKNVLEAAKLSVESFSPGNRKLTASNGQAKNESVIMAIESQFGTFLDHVSEGLSSQLEALSNQFTLAEEISSLIPTLGNEIVIPGIAGIKRDLVGGAIVEMVKQAAIQPSDTQVISTYGSKAHALFIDSPDRIMEGEIQLIQPRIIKENGNYRGRFGLELRNATTGERLIPPASGLTLRFRLGGNAREGVDYQVPEQHRYRTLWIPPGHVTAWIDLDLNAESLLTETTSVEVGARAMPALNLQVEILGAHSGFSVDAARCVANLPLVSGGYSDLDHGQVLSRSEFEPSKVIEAKQEGDQWIVRSDPRTPNAVLRGRSDAANIFLLTPGSVGLPHVENFNADRDTLAFNGNWVISDQSQESKALSKVEVIAGLVVDRSSGKALALISDYTPENGDHAYSTMRNSSHQTLITLADADMSGDWLVKAKSGGIQRFANRARATLSFNPTLGSVLGRSEAFEVVLQTTDDQGLPNGDYRVLLSQLGEAAGQPVGFDQNTGRQLELGNGLTGGHARFSLRGIATGQIQELDLVAPTAAEAAVGQRRFGLSLAGRAIASLELLSPEEQQSLPDQVDGFGMPLGDGDGSNNIDRLTGLGLNKLGAMVSDHDRSIEISATIYREAAFDNIVGFGLLRSTDGALIEATNGQVVANVSDKSFLEKLHSHAVWQGRGQNAGPVAVKDTFTLAGTINLSEVYLLPFIKVGGTGVIYTAGQTLNDNTSHIQPLAPTIYGFEDLPKGGDFDYDDVIIKVEGLRFASSEASF